MSKKWTTKDCSENESENTYSSAKNTTVRRNQRLMGLSPASSHFLEVLVSILSFVCYDS